MRETCIPKMKTETESGEVRVYCFGKSSFRKTLREPQAAFLQYIKRTKSLFTWLVFGYETS
jgi:hypothetical protein